MSNTFDDWFDENISTKCIVNGYNWGETFATILWWLWRWPNILVFQSRDLQATEKIEQIHKQRKEFDQVFNHGDIS